MSSGARKSPARAMGIASSVRVAELELGLYDDPKEVRPRLTVVPVTSRLPSDTHPFLAICFNVKRTRLMLSLWLGLLCMVSVPPARGDAPRTGRQVDFNEQVRPILARHCFKCHGPDEKARKAKLRLDLGDEAMKPASSGERPIVPGHPDESELVRRIFAEEPEELMPPPEAKLPLSDGDRQVLKQWVAQGAKYEPHWAFRQPVRPAIPVVHDPTWVRNPIDAFVLARLEAAGLRPSPEADRATLLRRVSLDLMGLPPTPEEVDAFLADRAADAYEKRVDRLLASPHYGERWARLARSGALCRHQRLREGSPALDLALSRLGDSCPQRRPALRPVHDRAARRRHAARRRRSSSGSPPASIATRCSTKKGASTRWSSASTR